jgi:transcriptional regulator GlxA family with amidase domain
MSRNIFADFIKKIFGKDVATRVLRQVVVSDAIDTKMAPKERMKLAKNMGHTIETSQAEYSKFSKALNANEKKIAELEAIIEQMRKEEAIKDKIILDLLAVVTKK